MHYYKAKEARHVLGDITPKQLMMLVKRRKLNRYTPPEGGQEVYSKDEVDTLARQRRDFWGKLPGEEEDSNGRGTVDASYRSKAV